MRTTFVLFTDTKPRQPYVTLIITFFGMMIVMPVVNLFRYSAHRQVYHLFMSGRPDNDALHMSDERSMRC